MHGMCDGPLGNRPQQTPPRYVANEVLMDVYGERHGSLTDSDIRQTVLNAAIRVASNPRCGEQINV